MTNEEQFPGRLMNNLNEVAGGNIRGYERVEGGWDILVGDPVLRVDAPMTTVFVDERRVGDSTYRADVVSEVLGILRVSRNLYY